MPWSNFDYETQLKVIDKINLLSHEEPNWMVANAIKAASQELEVWCNNRVYAEEKNVLEDFVETGKILPDTRAAEIKTQNKSAQKFITILFALLGSVIGGLMINTFPEMIVFIGAIVGAIVFATLGSAISKRK